MFSVLSSPLSRRKSCGRRASNSDTGAECFSVKQRTRDQMVRYYGSYSNRARGERAKREAEPGAPQATDVDVIDDQGVIEKILRHLKLWRRS